LRAKVRDGITGVYFSTPAMELNHIYDHLHTLYYFHHHHGRHGWILFSTVQLPANVGVFSFFKKKGIDKETPTGTHMLYVVCMSDIIAHLRYSPTPGSDENIWHTTRSRRS
jgi:hypothetical protein